MGGILTELLSWRYIFYINVPVALAGILISIRYIPPEARTGTLKNILKKLDIAGSIYLYLCLFCLTIGLSLISRAKASPIFFLVLIILGVVFLLLFLQREQKCPEPLIDTSLFSKPFILILFSTFIGYILMTGNGFLIPFYLMGPLGLTPARSGLMILFFSLSFAFFSSQAGRLADTRSPKVIGSLGMFGTAAAFAFFTGVIASRSVLQTALFLFFYGAAFAFFVAPTNKLLTSYAPANKQGVANGLYRTAVFFASLVGLAIYGSLLDCVEASSMLSCFSSIYLWSILLPLGSCPLLYFSRLPSALDDQSEGP